MLHRYDQVFFLVYSDLSSLEKLFFLFFFPPCFREGKVGILNAVYCFRDMAVRTSNFQKGRRVFVWKQWGEDDVYVFRVILVRPQTLLITTWIASPDMVVNYCSAAAGDLEKRGLGFDDKET
jgi:hypothetical protein